ncbi:hypothetical protein KCP71_23740 [Salmonella enterica subsp. enterica]|nr:hypothetical protein KCP71_23740 [Salmonella enterica subsp. enterica]
MCKTDRKRSWELEHMGHRSPVLMMTYLSAPVRRPVAQTLAASRRHVSRRRLTVPVTPCRTRCINRIWKPPPRFSEWYALDPVKTVMARWWGVPHCARNR